MSELRRTRLDTLLRRHCGISKREVRQLLITKQVFVDGFCASSMNQVIEPFSQVKLNDQWVQCHTPQYIMLNKPKGVVSATCDKQHKTVLDLINSEAKHQLHIAGRLDFNTTGLVLLTNNSAWSKRLSLPDQKTPKKYHVTLEHPINDDYIHTFNKGIYFAYEDITTRPAKLVIIDDYTAELELVEGRYHQVKRMFGYFQNPVLELHRLSIGNLELDERLLAGESRVLNSDEVDTIFFDEHNEC